MREQGVELRVGHGNDAPDEIGLTLAGHARYVALGHEKKRAPSRPLVENASAIPVFFTEQSSVKTSRLNGGNTPSCSVSQLSGSPAIPTEGEAVQYFGSPLKIVRVSKFKLLF